jgi:hypothetical protein
MAENETVAKQIGLVLRRLDGIEDASDEAEMDAD